MRFIDGERKSVRIDEPETDLLDFLKEVKHLAPEKIKQRVQDAYAKLVPFELPPLDSRPAQAAAAIAPPKAPHPSELHKALETVLAIAGKDISDSWRIAEKEEEINKVMSHWDALTTVRRGLPLLTATWTILEETAGARDKMTAIQTVSEVLAKVAEKRGDSEEQKGEKKVRRTASPG